MHGAHNPLSCSLLPLCCLLLLHSVNQKIKKFSVSRIAFLSGVGWVEGKKEEVGEGERGKVPLPIFVCVCCYCVRMRKYLYTASLFRCAITVNRQLLVQTVERPTQQETMDRNLDLLTYQSYTVHIEEFFFSGPGVQRKTARR